MRILGAIVEPAADLPADLSHRRRVSASKQAVARLPDCQVDLHGSFDDGQTMEATGVDVCADKTLNLKD